MSLRQPPLRHQPVPTRFRRSAPFAGLAGSFLRHLAAAAFVFAAQPCVHAQAQAGCSRFTEIPDLGVTFADGARPIAISDDGSRIACEYVYWSAQAGSSLNPGIPGTAGLPITTAMSGNGQVLALESPAGAFRFEIGGALQQVAGAAIDLTGLDYDGDVMCAVEFAGQAAASYRWTPGGFSVLSAPGLSDVVARGVSGNGQFIVGQMRAPGGEYRPFRWSPASGFEDLLASHGGSGLSVTMATAAACNFDGTVVVGYLEAPAPGIARAPYAWHESTGIEVLSLPQGAFAGQALGVSPSGDQIVGFWRSQGTNNRAARWAGGRFDVELPAQSQPYQGQLIDVSGGGQWAAALSLEANATVERGFRMSLTPIGAPYCGGAVPNSTGCAGYIDAVGSADASENHLSLVAGRLPANVFGFFLTSRDSGNTAIANSSGILCLGGFIGRFVGPGQVMDTGAEGRFELSLDLTAIPVQFGSGTVQAGDTWRFQAWHRDVDVSGSNTSNLTNAVAVGFR